jgi:aspartate carbamoyltransferase regulatory subunit
VEKREVEIPRRIEDLITCPNPNCISNSRKEHLASEFRSFEFESKLYFQCAYCDYLIERKDISKYMKRLS